MKIMEFQITSGIRRYFDIKLDNRHIAQSNYWLYTKEEHVTIFHDNSIVCIGYLVIVMLNLDSD